MRRGLAPSRSEALGFLPEGGGRALAGRLVEAIRAYGGEVRTRRPVERIRFESGRVAGVVLRGTGELLDAGVVVSNADPERTVLGLVGEAHFRPETVERVRSVRMSLPPCAVHGEPDVDPGAAGLPNRGARAAGARETAARRYSTITTPRAVACSSM